MVTHVIPDDTLEAIENTVSKIPGVVAFSDFKKVGLEQDGSSTTDVINAIEYSIVNKIHLIHIHLILLMGINIKDVLNEVQVTVKYELEKNSNYSKNYQIDVAVDDFKVIS